jgi:hypothetical protein
MANKTRVSGKDHVFPFSDCCRQERIAKGANRSGKSFDGGGFLERPAREDGPSR